MIEVKVIRLNKVYLPKGKIVMMRLLYLLVLYLLVVLVMTLWYLIQVLLSICVMINSCFLIFVNLSTSVKVEVGDGRPLTAVGEGTVSLKVNLPNNKVENRTLEKVLYVPDLAHNLISISQVTLGGKITKFYGHSCKIFSKENKLLAVGKRLGKLYTLDCFQKAAAHCPMYVLMKCYGIVDFVILE